jgi:hypothetical protein
LHGLAGTHSAHGAKVLPGAAVDLLADAGHGFVGLLVNGVGVTHGRT